LDFAKVEEGAVFLDVNIPANPIDKRLKDSASRWQYNKR